jgi:hypothetical protein
MPIAESRREFDQVARSRGTENDACVVPFGSANQLTRHDQIQSLAEGGLPENCLAGIEVDALRRGGQQNAGLRRAGQQFRNRGCLDRIHVSEPCLWLHGFLSLVSSPRYQWLQTQWSGQRGPEGKLSVSFSELIRENCR